MTDRPILFSGPMVRALLDGRKTQTRRILKPQPSDYTPKTVAPQRLRGEPPKHPAPYFDAYNGGPNWCWWDEYDRQGADWIKCPYGKPGDGLWVKETFKPHSTFAHLKPSEIPDSKIFYAADESYAPSNTKWWPSLFMQRRFSRIALRITDIRVERLNNCSEADALAEGVQDPGLVPILGAFWSSRDGYARLWEHINGKGSWSANPWVWVVSFERVSA